jgi:translation initiation factor IF-3
MVEKAKEFLKEDGQVKVNMRLRGAQLRKIPMALDHVKSFIKALGEVNVVQEPKFEAKVIRAIVARKK